MESSKIWKFCVVTSQHCLSLGPWPHSNPGVALPTDTTLFSASYQTCKKVQQSVTFLQKVVNRGLNRSRDDNQLKNKRTMQWNQSIRKLLALSAPVPPCKSTRFISNLSSTVLTRLPGRRRVATDVIINPRGYWAARQLGTRWVENNLVFYKKKKQNNNWANVKPFMGWSRQSHTFTSRLKGIQT